MTKLALNLRPSTTLLPANAGMHLLYVWLEGSLHVAQPQRPALHCCLVVDCSPSMRIPIADSTLFSELLQRGLASERVIDGLPVWQIEGGIPADLRGRTHSTSRWVVQALGSAVERLHGADQFSLVAFAANTHVLLNHQSPQATPLLRQALQHVEQADFGDSTTLAPALERTLDLIRAQQQPGRSERVLLITDGFVTDEPACLRLIEQFAAQDVVVSTLGLGIDFQESLLLALADQTGGTANLVTDPARIPALLDRELQQAQRIQALHPRIGLRLAQGVELRRIYRLRPMLAELARPVLTAGAGSFNPGPLDPSMPPAVLLELLVPPHDSGTFRLCRASLEASALDGQPLPTAHAELVVDYRAAAQLTTDPQLQPLIDRVAAWRAQTRALDAAVAGNTDQATRQLEVAVTQLLELGEHDLAAQTAKTAEKLAADGVLDAADRKRLRYATRRLTHEP